MHVYDSLLQSAKLVLDVGGGQAEDDFILLAEANVLRFRALRCYKLGLTYENLGEFKNAIGVLGLAQNLATETAEQFQTLDSDSR